MAPFAQPARSFSATNCCCFCSISKAHLPSWSLSRAVGTHTRHSFKSPSLVISHCPADVLIHQIAGSRAVNPQATPEVSEPAALELSRLATVPPAANDDSQAFLTLERPMHWPGWLPPAVVLSCAVSSLAPRSTVGLLLVELVPQRVELSRDVMPLGLQRFERRELWNPLNRHFAERAVSIFPDE